MKKEVSAPKKSPFEVHVCRGLNECKGQGKNGSGTMPGDGECATAVTHTCYTHNSCKGQGGCGVGPADVQEHPGENACKGKGGCAVPITTNRSSAGKYNGKLVWEAARELFEKRIKKKGKDVAKAPPAK